MTKLFGFQIGNQQKDREKEKTFAIPNSEDGAVVVQTGGHYATYVDLDGVVRNEIELITRYREMSNQPELESAIDDIVNESIVMDDSGKSVEISVDDLEAPAAIKKKITEEFEYVLKLLNFGNMGSKIFRRWYIDGRLFYQIIIDEENPGAGIQEVRYIDPRRIRKIREIQKTKDPATGIDIIKSEVEYYLYNDKGMMGAHTNLGSKIAIDSVVNVNSGLMDGKRAMVLSYLHKAIKPLTNLRQMEDAMVINRLSRASDRRIFYVDVGTMSTVKAEQYLRDIMVKYRNKLTYDSETGEIRDDRRHLSMVEDFWIPRREGNLGSKVENLPGLTNFGTEDVNYFKEKLNKALGIPISRLEQNNGFSLGRTTEITRDELKFTKFIQRLRSDFSQLFDDLLKIQLALKNVCSTEEWSDLKEKLWYDYKKDNNFNELKESELWNIRFDLLAKAIQFSGRLISDEWAWKHILMFTEDEIEQIKKEIKQQQIDNPVDVNGNPLPKDQDGNVIQQGVQPDLPGQEQQDPLVDQSKQRFTNDTLELPK